MVKRFSCIVRLVLCCIVIAATMQVHAQTGDLLVIRGGTLIDPMRADLGVPGTIIVQNSLIIDVRPGDDSPPPAGARVIDAEGAYVMPGIADMHNHLRSGMFKPGGDQAAVLRSLLDWGITTTFDPGVPIAEFDALRTEISKNRRAYPRAFLV